MNRRKHIMPLAAALLSVSWASFGQPEPVGPGAPTRAQEAREDARWSDLEAQRRATDGDYDGAVLAHQQAEQALQEARRRETIEQSGH